jgi:ribulose-bisphosphate carboxylase small chain
LAQDWIRVLIRGRLPRLPACPRFPGAFSAPPLTRSRCAPVPDRTPTNNKFFETFSFLPPLSNDEISKQVAYIVNNGWTPCLEFAEPEQAYVSSESSIRYGPVSSGYQDNRYWTMWKLPMFGCQNGDQVLGEMANCIKAFPEAYVRLVAFDSVRQVQMCGFLIHRPPNATEFQAPEKRSVA